MRILGVVHASELESGDQLVGAFANPGMPESSVVPLDVQSVFNTGHGRVQVTTGQIGSGWFHADDLICVLRELSL